MCVLHLLHEMEHLVAGGGGVFKFVCYIYYMKWSISLRGRRVRDWGERGEMKVL